jgi:ubiquinone/menaquinone biosynthesis C-methylase UbiE
MASKDHWENVYATKTSKGVSWFQEHAQLSLKLINDAKIPTSASIIDVGGGASTLVDDLVAQGYQHISVLDLSQSALTETKKRLGVAAAAQVQWIEANILEVELPVHQFDVWHDRAVFHFLTNEIERHAYVQKVLGAVKPGGLVIIATFAEDGPTMCSGLPVKRYSENELYAEFGAPFQLLSHQKEIHHTPAGGEQKFVYCVCRKVP